MTGATTKHTATSWLGYLLVLLLVICVSSPALGHGGQDLRTILLYDLSSKQDHEAAKLMAVSNAYQNQLLIH